MTAYATVSFYDRLVFARKKLECACCSISLQASSHKKRAGSFSSFGCFQVVWDDNEEQRYREWLKEVAAQRQNDVDWNEYEGEEEYRARLREQAEARADQDIPINWDDQKEREYRRKYIEMR